MIELDWIKYARTHVGMHEVKHEFILKDWLNDLNVSWLSTKAAWCGIYCAKILKETGIKYPKNFYRALAWLDMGTPLIKPAYGCIAVKTRNGGGHVCFVVGQLKDGRLVCLGGNQSNSVCFAIYRIDEFAGFRWYGRTAKPAMMRYELPVLKLDGSFKTKVTES